MKNLKKELDDIENKISSLKEKQNEAYKKCVKEFNKKAELFLNNGYKIFKYNSSHGERYVLSDSITSFHIAVKNSMRGLCTLDMRGISFAVKKDYIVVSDMAVKPFSDIFTFFDDITEITIDDFNSIINKWIDHYDNVYFLNPEEGYEPIKEWFSEEHYDKYFSKYLHILNNDKLNKKFETEINNKNNGN